jgi:hypothetical protein
MSLRKSPTMTPARLEDKRRNARKSTGPRTEAGKSQSRMNSLRTGSRSRLVSELFLALYDAPPGAVLHVARTLPPELTAHPMFAEMVEGVWQADVDLLLEEKEKLVRAASLAGNPKAGAARHSLGLTHFCLEEGFRNLRKYTSEA